MRAKRPNFAAAVAPILAALIIVAPGLFLTHRLWSQASRGVEAIKTQTESGQWRATVESNPRLARALSWIAPQFDVRSLAERAANFVAAQLSSLVGGSVWTLAQLLITFFTLFYLFRDRGVILGNVKSLVPLSGPETDKLLYRVRDTIHATLYGTFVVALIQAVLGGAMFWLLGLPAPLFWGMVMTLLALIPVLGAPVVWIPAAIFLALTGSGIRHSFSQRGACLSSTALQPCEVFR